MPWILFCAARRAPDLTHFGESTMRVHREENLPRHAGLHSNSLLSAFRLEEGGFVIDTSTADDGQVRDISGACPSGALTIEED
jgi:hypothetical protein